MKAVKIANHNQNPFAQIERQILSDQNISYGAKGLLAYLLSRPSHPAIKVQDIQDHGTEGKYTIRRIISELVELGYLIRRPIRLVSGRLSGVEYIIQGQEV